MEGHDTRKLRVAVIGSGPAGAYAAEHLLSRDEHEIEVDMFERLPTPWGLVRSGVAPDHPKIKSVTRVYEKTAGHPRFRFFGNVELGVHVSRGELIDRYDAVIYAVGTPGDRPIGIPGEELPGSWAATDFVGWYNGHPDHRDLTFDLDCRRAIVVGNGNVALDVARMLTLTGEALRGTDMADHAIEALERSRIEEVVVVGRRGPEQAAFTNPELRELGELSGAGVHADPAELAIPDALRESDPSPAALRNLEILRDYANRPREAGRRRISLRFLLSPTRLLGEQRVEAVELARNELRRAEDGSLRAHTGEARVAVPAGLVLRAVGYRGRRLPGVPFDEARGVIPSTDGRVAPGEYVVGWAKRGPSGVIGTNKKCALDTVNTLLDDLRSGRLPAPGGPASGDSMASLLATRQPRVVTFADWQSIDRHEQQLGESAGRPRVKLTRVAEMLDVAAPAPASDRVTA
jgi:ferredoxin/flavodoxin---NADP+ reductase